MYVLSVILSTYLHNLHLSVTVMMGEMGGDVSVSCFELKCDCLPPGLSHGHSSCRFRTWAVTVGSSTQGVFESQPLLLLGFLLCPFVQALP